MTWHPWFCRIAGVVFDRLPLYFPTRAAYLWVASRAWYDIEMRAGRIPGTKPYAEGE